MKADRKKLELAMAQACMNTGALAAAAAMPKPTLNNVMQERGVSPATIGKVARALGVDVTTILKTED
jgi:uncharacterized protein YerC